MEERQANLFGRLQGLASEWDRMRYVGTRGYGAGMEERPWAPPSAWVPNADVFARGEDLVVRVQLAGVGREDVEVTLRDDVLTISGERRGDPREEGHEPYVTELFYGQFRRDVNLPPGTDGSRIEAVFNNGMVEITVKGAAAARAREPQRIEVKESSD
ncbi:Hsp20/alpha crystallin family protein [Rubrobacter marinus]|nr:Hsp20/alpha crystallin family protein [Rubrobacter marinus]